MVRAVNSNGSKACVVIPIYQEAASPYEQIAMDQCFSVLHQHAIYFVIPSRLEVFIQTSRYVLSGQASYVTFDDAFFKDIPGYNRLLKYPGFYKKFLQYDFMLIYQLDAFVFRDELMQWSSLGYDTIGAPLFEGDFNATANSPIIGQGNGGFCLRNIKSCYQVASSWRKLKFIKEYTDSNRSIFRNIYRYIKHQLVYIYSGYPFQPILNEDKFWAQEIPKVFPDFKVPDPQLAVGFSFEMNPEVLFKMNHQQLPFGCHAWERYDLDFWKPFIQSYGYEL